MSLLQEISISVQQVAEAISIAVGVEVEIVDERLTIIGGTGIYKKRVGKKEESGRLDGNFLYARVLRKGGTEYIEDAQAEKNYGLNADSKKGTSELAEICTPIKKGNQTLGVIGLIAFSDEQKSILLDKDRSMVTFVEKMAELLSAKVTQQEALRLAELSKSEMMTILETAHEGIIAIDKGGYVRHCNSLAAALFRAKKNLIIGAHLNKYMLGSPALNIFKTGKGYTENEELYRSERGGLHVIVTAKPFYDDRQIEGLVISFRDIKEAQALAYQMRTQKVKNNFDDLLGESPAILKLKSQALLTARGESTVLISGEPGTGKEFLAKAIHYSGPRANKPFVVVNCASIPSELLERELFGQEPSEEISRNAKTAGKNSAKDINNRTGKFRLAQGGTIFLNEVDTVPGKAQIRILDIVQKMRTIDFEGKKEEQVDVRIISATDKDLEQLIKKGKFREDLFYKLSVIPIEIPRLADRKEDIPIFMEYFLRRYNSFMKRSVSGFSEEVKQIFIEYCWPGNIRELENAIEYGVNMTRGEVITKDDLPSRIVRKDQEKDGKLIDSTMTLAEQVKQFEREVIKDLLIKHGIKGTGKEITAKKLGLSTATLYRRLQELEINTKLL